jgi:hypothetical protein
VYLRFLISGVFWVLGFILIGNQRNFIKSIGVAKHIESKQKGHKKWKKTKENKKPQTPNRNQSTNPRQNYIIARAFLLSPWQEPRLLASKLIEHSKFFNSLLPLSLGVKNGTS